MKKLFENFRRYLAEDGGAWAWWEHDTELNKLLRLEPAHARSIIDVLKDSQPELEDQYVKAYLARWKEINYRWDQNINMGDTVPLFSKIKDQMGEFKEQFKDAIERKNNPKSDVIVPFPDL